jgi:DMSO/TMAO reductase YedYZ molybdopterin-dependent catalytic subunit
MTNALDPLLRIEGEVDRPLHLQFTDLEAIGEEHQITDVSRTHPKRQGGAVRLAGLLELAQCRPGARYLGLHSARDDFHASVPLDAVRDHAFIIYRLHGEPLPASAGGPLRFFVPDHAACHTHEVDECANVKFVDRIELTAEKGYDNRPHDEAEHAALHRES